MSQRAHQFMNARAPEISPAFVVQLTPSIDEIVQFVRALQLLGEAEIRWEMRDVLLPFLAKTEEDVKRLLLKDGFKSLVVTALKFRDEALAVMKAKDGVAA